MFVTGALLSVRQGVLELLQPRESTSFAVAYIVLAISLVLESISLLRAYQQLRKEAASRGLNPNIWFNNVEVVAADRIGAETVTYVSNIFKYYIAYKLLTEQAEERRKAREALKKG